MWKNTHSRWHTWLSDSIITLGNFFFLDFNSVGYQFPLYLIQYELDFRVVYCFLIGTLTVTEMFGCLQQHTIVPSLLHAYLNSASKCWSEIHLPAFLLGKYGHKPRRWPMWYGQKSITGEDSKNTLKKGFLFSLHFEAWDEEAVVTAWRINISL